MGTLEMIKGEDFLSTTGNDMIAMNRPIIAIEIKTKGIIYIMPRLR